VRYRVNLNDMTPGEATKLLDQIRRGGTPPKLTDVEAQLTQALASIPAGEIDS
jgi:hypothetical protein